MENDSYLSNPYIGWYTIYGYSLDDTYSASVPSYTCELPLLSNEAPLQKYDGTELSCAYPSMALLEINLKNYSDCDISSYALNKLDNILSSWSLSKTSLIVRFVYDWDGQNLLTEPESLEQIQTHMKQVSEIVNSYTSCIYLLQGIFVGNWGEMNNTIHMADGKMETLINTLADATDPSIFLSVRTPAQLRTITKGRSPMQSSYAFDGTLSSRLGLFNDGLLGSSTDTGTYGTESALTAAYTSAWPRQDELEFQNKLCRYVPNGGEVIIENELNDIENAVSDFSTMHISYLNSAYDEAVLNKWKNSSSPSEKLNGYDYIGTHLGYRYVIRASSFKTHTFSTDELFVTVENVGFANALRDFDITVYAISNTNDIYSFQADTDTRFWNSSESVTFSVPISTYSLPDGQYDIYISCYDPFSDRTVFFANTASDSLWIFDSSSYSHTVFAYKLAELEINGLFP